MSKDRCPPHKFKAAWAASDSDAGVIFCRACGLVMPLDVPAIEAPAEEHVCEPGCPVPHVNTVLFDPPAR